MILCLKNTVPCIHHSGLPVDGYHANVTYIDLDNVTAMNHRDNVTDLDHLDNGIYTEKVFV